MTVSVIADGLADVQSYFDLVPDTAARAARLAINDTTRRVAVRESIKLMQEEVAFPPGYLTDPRRFRVEKFATESDLESVVAARHRPTSLARFSTGGAVGRAGVRVQVSRGRSREMGRAFLIRLPQGRGPVTDEAFNLALAIRLKDGESITNKRITAVSAGNGLYFLYGPSVNQVFRTVAADVAPQVADDLATQFVRQFVRLSGGPNA
jgi:hypothetical protein